MLSRLSYANHAHCPATCAADWTPAVHLCIQGSVVAAQNAQRTSLAPSSFPAARLSAAFSSSGTAATTVQTAATAAAQEVAAQGKAGVDNCQSGTEGARAHEVLVALGQYNPTGLCDGPASLSQVLPYNAAVYEQALQHGAQLLHSFTVYRLSNIAAALAAAGHFDDPFMRQLGDEAAQLLQQAPAVEDNAAAVAQLKALSYLAVAYARIGLLHTELFTQLAVTGAKLLLRGRLRPSKRLHAQYIAQLAAAYAALKLYPPLLFKAIGELLKQQRQVVSLLGPQESMLLLWAFARVEHKDPPAQLLLTQRAATQVGQLDCKGLAHAYIQCAQAKLTAPPLLAALRKATRQRLPAMSPQDLTALLTALAALGQQDSLLLDEAAKVVHNKLMNFTAGQISSTLSALNLLRYRNPWLLEHASKILVSSRLNKAAQLSAAQLADLLAALSQLRYHNTRLLDHLGSVATKHKTLNSWPASELAAVLQGFSMLGFSQPMLQEAAAVRLLQLASVGSTNKLQQQELQQPQQQQPAADLVDAAYYLASISVSGSGTAEVGSVTAAVAAVAAAALQQQEQCSCTDWIKLSIAVLLGSPQQCGLAAAGTADLQVSITPAEHVMDKAAHVSEQTPPAAAGSLQQQQHDRASADVFLPQVLQHVQSEAQAVAEAAIAAGHEQLLGAELLSLMQLLWLHELQPSTNQEVLARQHSTTAEQQGTDSNQTQAQQQPLQFRKAAAAAAAAAELTAEQCVHMQQQTPDAGAKRGPGQEWQQQQQQRVWQLGLSEQVVDSYVQLHLKKYSQQQDQRQQQQQQRQAEELVLLRATMLAIQQQLHGLDAKVQAPYLIPGSPLIVPAAVIPSSSTRSLGKRGHTIAAASDGSGDDKSGRSRSSQRQDSKDVQLQSTASSIQQQHELQQLQQRAVMARVQLQQGRVQLPSEVLSQVKIWVAAEVPFAVFVCTQEPSGLSGRFSGGLPAELLSVGGHWAEGLACAGWGLLLLDTQQAL